MTRLLAIDADLSAPPSSVSVWRDVTLWSAIRQYEIVAVAPEEMCGFYSNWFVNHGLWDYVDDIITPQDLAREKVLVYIQGGPEARLTHFNLSAVLALL